MNLSGSPLDFLIAFFGGILVSFTPCVYPLMPITAGFIGATSSGSRAKGFRLSLVYVTGIAITYAMLGILASLTGSIFGQWSSHPLTYIFVGVLIIIFGFSMLDVFALPLPQLARLPLLKKHSYLSTFILGLASGLIVSPCLTPVLGSILVYLTTKKELFYGGILLLSFAYGIGLVLILIGTFSAILVNLPRSGKWLTNIKKICAMILFGTGAYFILTGIRRF